MYHEHYGSVVGSAWAVTRNRASAEEHAQEAFARAFARWRSLGRSGYATAWIHRVAINLAIDEVRRLGRHSDRDVVANTGEPSLEPLEVAEALSRLSRRQREAVVLRVMADLSEADVAALMGVSPGSVKTHKSRGLDRLRTLMTREPAHG